MIVDPFWVVLYVIVAVGLTVIGFIHARTYWRSRGFPPSVPPPPPFRQRFAPAIKPNGETCKLCYGDEWIGKSYEEFARLTEEEQDRYQDPDRWFASDRVVCPRCRLRVKHVGQVPPKAPPPRPGSNPPPTHAKPPAPPNPPPPSQA